nr:MAG TPA: hypothetical protein [Caudoviricetes sp.]
MHYQVNCKIMNNDWTSVLEVKFISPMNFKLLHVVPSMWCPLGMRYGNRSK